MLACLVAYSLKPNKPAASIPNLIPSWGVCHEAVIEMEEGPLRSISTNRPQTTFRGFTLRGEVLSGEGKGYIKSSCEKCGVERKRTDWRRVEIGCYSPKRGNDLRTSEWADKVRCIPVSVGVGIKAARTHFRLYDWTWEPSLGFHQRWGGWNRSSDDHMGNHGGAKGGTLSAQENPEHFRTWSIGTTEREDDKAKCRD